MNFLNHCQRETDFSQKLKNLENIGKIHGWVATSSKSNNAMIAGLMVNIDPICCCMCIAGLGWVNISNSI